ncbi:hypothetical protein J6590_077932 [Homalodisca vitripennis]|nr:hypothetical protein J6590_077932 [Homalodisca vitripennis]
MRFCDGNARAAQREYQARYPDRNFPVILCSQDAINVLWKEVQFTKDLTKSIISKSAHFHHKTQSITAVGKMKDLYGFKIMLQSIRFLLIK